MIYLQSLTQAELSELLAPANRALLPGLSDDRVAKRSRYQAKQIFHWVYQRHVLNWEGMSDLAKDLRAWLAANVAIYRLKERVANQAEDGTRKFLWDLADGKTIESVIIPAALQEKTKVDAAAPEDGRRFSGRRAATTDLDGDHWSRLTACISSQVGCAMACKFCLTGIQGLDRSLQTHEIVTQVLELRRLAPITNIVFMGMGEPLHNFDHVVQACRILLDTDGLNFSKRKVTVSTSGLVPAIEKLGASGVDVSLAISLNSSTDEQRSELMPVNRKWNIGALMSACRSFPLGSHRRITFEYVMIAGFNDTLDDAARVVRLTRGIPCKVNLIPFNEHPGAPYKRPSDKTVRAFQEHLMARKLVATVRISRGRDILAACGQLRSVFGTARGSDRHTDWQSGFLSHPQA